jgi:hypothetical protein
VLSACPRGAGPCAAQSWLLTAADVVVNPNQDGIGQKLPTFFQSNFLKFFIKLSIKLKIRYASQNILEIFFT